MSELSTRLDGVTTDRMMDHLGVLAGWTKHAGTASERESLDYVRSVLDGYGYRTEVLEHDAYISLPVRASVETSAGDGGHTWSALAHSFSRATDADGVSAPAVYVGNGQAADYADVDVRGCIAVIEGVAGAEATLEAARHGAVGQVHVSPHEHRHEMCVSPVWGNPDDLNLHRLPDVPVVSLSRSDGAALRQACQQGRPTLTVRAELDTGWRTTPILVADLPAAGDPDGPFVLFSGHHDTWHYGVMDNGTANVTMLEVARLVAEGRDHLRRGLRLIFWSGHSQGRYSSSSWYADHHWEELDARALVHINVDSTGGRGNTVVSDVCAAAELGGLAARIIADHAGEEWTGRRMARAGDQAFWGIGVPAMFALMGEQPATDPGDNPQAAVFGREPRRGNGTGWWWHTTEDLLDKIDPDVLTRDTRIYLDAVWTLLTEPVLPFDFTATARSIAARLRELDALTSGDLQLGVAVRRAEQVETLVRELQDAHARGLVDDEQLNREHVRLARLLTPVDYCAGDRFDQDPALFVGAVPALQDADLLAGLDRDSDDYRFMRTRMWRRRNRVVVGLRDAVDHLQAVVTATRARTNP